MVKEHYDMTFLDLIKKIENHQGEFKAKDKFELFLQLISSIDILQNHYNHCNINPEAILFKSLNKHKEATYKKKGIPIIYANEMAYSVKLGEFDYMRPRIINCFLKTENDIILKKQWYENQQIVIKKPKMKQME